MTFVLDDVLSNLPNTIYCSLVNGIEIVLDPLKIEKFAILVNNVYLLENGEIRQDLLENPNVLFRNLSHSQDRYILVNDMTFPNFLSPTRYLRIS
jgi:hypothetical protein